MAEVDSNDKILHEMDDESNDSTYESGGTSEILVIIA